MQVESKQGAIPPCAIGGITELQHASSSVGTQSFPTWTLTTPWIESPALCAPVLLSALRNY